MVGTSPWGSCPQGSCAQGNCPLSSCPRVNCPLTLIVVILADVKYARWQDKTPLVSKLIGITGQFLQHAFTDTYPVV